MKGAWLNTTVILHQKLDRPCHVLQWCPYGQLVEEYPFTDGLGCEFFGHDCPAYYLAEAFNEQDKEKFAKMICERNRRVEGDFSN